MDKVVYDGVRNPYLVALITILILLITVFTYMYWYQSCLKTTTITPSKSFSLDNVTPSINRENAVNIVHDILDCIGMSGLEIGDIEIDKIDAFTSIGCHCSYHISLVNESGKPKGTVIIDGDTGLIKCIWFSDYIFSTCNKNVSLDSVEARNMVLNVLNYYNYSLDENIDVKVLTIVRTNSTITISYIFKIYGYPVYSGIIEGGGKVIYNPCYNYALLTVPSKTYYLYSLGQFNSTHPHIGEDDAIRCALKAISERYKTEVVAYNISSIDVWWFFKDIDKDGFMDKPVLSYFITIDCVLEDRETLITVFIDAYDGEPLYVSG